MSTDELLESDAERMSDSEVREFLRREGVGVLGLPAPDAPYLLPLSFGFDGDSTLYFVFLRFGPESLKVQLSEGSPTARFLVYRADSVHEWRSVQLTGPIDEVADDEWPALRDAMANAWHPDVFSSAAPMRGIAGYRLEATGWTGIQHVP
jgi:hypothetical protein